MTVKKSFKNPLVTVSYFVHALILRLDMSCDTGGHACGATWTLTSA